MKEKELSFLIEQTKNICAVKIKNKEKSINDSLYNIATTFNSVAYWNECNGAKYFIGYNNISKSFAVEVTWTSFVAGIVYFSDKNIANKALIENESDMNNLAELYSIYSKLCSNKLCINDVNKLKELILYYY